MAIDQQRVTRAVLLAGEAGQMNLAHLVQWQGANVGARIAVVVDAAVLDAGVYYDWVHNLDNRKTSLSR